MKPVTRVVSVGQRFGRLLVIDPEARTAGGRRAAICHCDCGAATTVDLSNLLRDKPSVRSCGCYLAEDRVARPRTHGLKGHPRYHSWRQMMRRCYDQTSKDYRWYGARGIGVCGDWHDIRAFVAWIDSNLGSCPPGMSLDRIDNDGNYEPGNVRWATRSEQIRNSRRCIREEVP